MAFHQVRSGLFFFCRLRIQVFGLPEPFIFFRGQIFFAESFQIRTIWGRIRNSGDKWNWFCSPPRAIQFGSTYFPHSQMGLIPVLRIRIYMMLYGSLSALEMEPDSDLLQFQSRDGILYIRIWIHIKSQLLVKIIALYGSISCTEPDPY